MKLGGFLIILGITGLILPLFNVQWELILSIEKLGIPIWKISVFSIAMGIGVLYLANLFERQKRNKETNDTSQKSDIGVLFDINELGGGFYGGKAQKIMMMNLNPGLLKGAILKVGDTRKTLSGHEKVFCIALYNCDVEYVKKSIGLLTDKGLLIGDLRFVESSNLKQEPLNLVGSIDQFGRLVTDRWMRIDHEICKVNGWGYAPSNIDYTLSKDILEELKLLMKIKK
jgi:hypothetical protein